MASSLKESNEVNFEQCLSGLKVTLNRPTKLNSLTYGMISQIYNTLKEHENDSNVKLVIFKGNGRAFCAGGDVAAFVQISTVGHWTFGAKYYNKQICLDYLLATYSMLKVSLIDGIVMGGGAGLSMHGTFRIATENAIFAMPETSIGLMPDVGASHFLTRLPGFFGEYLALTGSRIDGAEMAACGLATHFVLSKWEPSKLEMVTMEMVDRLFTEPKDVDWESLRLPARQNPAKTKTWDFCLYQ